MTELPPLDEADVANVFNALANEHAARLQTMEGHTTEQRIIEHLESRTLGHRQGFSWRRVALLTLAPAAAAAAVTAVAVTSFGPERLTYEVRGAANESGTIEASGTAAVLSFSDDSEIVAKAQSKLDVSVVGEHSALARLSQGKLHVKVHHERDTDWRFFAGPYEVRVIGTEFDMSWKPEAGELSVRMHEGRVRVVGPHTKPTILSAGEALTLSEPRPVAKLEALEADTVDAEVTPKAGPAPATPAVKATGKVASWTKLVAKGQFADVVADAERVGIERAFSTKSSAELQALAQAAHYTGRSSLALRTWSSIRERFAGQHSGRQASFFLGRLYDQQGNASQALRWLDTYLVEAGSGVYASEALGRKLTLVRRLQGNDAAGQVARQYLKRFPKGAYTKTARTILEN
jgi:TolA-binding protein